LRRYLDAGFNLISIDSRLAPETKLPFIIEDLRDAFGWVRQRGAELAGIDRDRIAVVGHSAGDQLITMTNRGHGFDGGRRAANDPEITQTFDRGVGYLRKHTMP
jgi:hypothetical protein